MKESPCDSDSSAGLHWAARLGLVAGPLLAIGVYFLLPRMDPALPQAAAATAALAVLMAAWWMTEAIPLEATSLLPLVLLPLLGVYSTPIGVGDVVQVRPLKISAKVVVLKPDSALVMTGIPDDTQMEVPLSALSKPPAIKRAAAAYADPAIYLFLGGFLIALAIEKWGLHRRLALLTILAVGTQPARLVGGFILATGLISMWISNTATTVMMLPIGLSVIALLQTRLEEAGTGVDKTAGANFATSLLLGLAYAASIGGFATLVGTPPNVFFASFLRGRGIEIDFGRWLLFAGPVSLAYLGICWWVLTHWLFPIRLPEIPGGRELIREELHKLGRVSRGEWVVLTVFLLTAGMWILREPLSEWAEFAALFPTIHSIDDPLVAMTGAIALFLIPIDLARGQFALDWKTALRVPWGVLLLFGGGMSLAVAIGDSGLARWIGQQVSVLGNVPPLVQILFIVTLIVFTGELTSNLAAVVAMLPILYEIGVGLKIDPLLLCVPAAVAASCGFMLPVATPPNAIVFGAGHIRMSQMIRAGWWLDLVAIVLVPLATYTLGKWVLGIRF
jgi:sodium-dependent dicarboxylate transporter 2/3/5